MGGVNDRRTSVAIVALVAFVMMVLPAGCEHRGPSSSTPPAGSIPPIRSRPSSGRGSELAPPEGALFGAFVQLVGRETHEVALERLESRLGRVLDLDRVYYQWDDTFPAEQEAADAARGRIPLLSWRAERRDGSAVPWASIADGAEDPWIAERAEALRAYASPIILIFHHEPERSIDSNGSPAEYVAAWRHLHEVFRAHGAVNIEWALALFAVTYQDGTATDFYPGDDVVDWIGADGYNRYGRADVPNGCNGSVWRSFGALFSALHRFATAHGKPAMAAEWGSPEDAADPGRKARWFEDALATIEAWPDVKGLAYFDADNSSSSGCDWRASSSAASFAAFKSIALDPYLNPRP